MTPLPRLAALTLATAAVGLGLAAVPAAGSAAGAPSSTPAPVPTLELVSRATDGTQREAHADLAGSAAAASADGRYVVFATSGALVRADRNEQSDVYLRDTQADRTVLVSRTPQGRAGDGGSVEPSISADGTVVAWTTSATDLLTGRRDRNGEVNDVVVRDLRTGRTVLASVDGRGRQHRAESVASAISGDGRHVAVQTFAALTRADTDEREDVYVRDLARRTTRKASWRPHGRDITQPHLVGTISHDGRVVTMGDDRHAWARDVVRGRTTLVWSEGIDPDSPFPMGSVGRPAVSGNGRYVAWPSAQVTGHGPTAGRQNVWRRDLRTGEVVRVTRGLGGTAPDGDSGLPSLSFDGTRVGVSTFAGNLVAGDPEAGDGEAVVVDLVTGTTVLASPGPEDPEGIYDESARTGIAISADGHTLVYESFDDHLVAGDTNGWGDVLAWRG
ncbi:hypothetical protein [Nocardioides litoris]|uniref:hypothetical protein n=1 Tax=Nocardioides litoris TaxID=1926648 RepID=UPI00112256A9|nr:hypothetical protein [Nocardioides litoris]